MSRAGYGIRVVQILTCKFDKDTPIRKQMFDESKVTDSYWCVSGPFKSKVLGECGHRHATREEAEEQCWRSMTKRYIELRWGKKKNVETLANTQG